MILLDVNILVYAFREDAPEHAKFRGWLEGVASAQSDFATSDLILSDFLRVVTHPRVFNPRPRWKGRSSLPMRFGLNPTGFHWLPVTVTGRFSSGCVENPVLGVT